MTQNGQNLETDERLMDDPIINFPYLFDAQSEQNAPITRTEILEVNGAVINLLTLRLKGRRFRPQAGDAMRLGYIRALIQALQSYNETLKTSELDELEQKIQCLERR
jgi:hypothetical protein